MNTENPPNFLACLVAGKPELATLADLREVLSARATASLLDARAAFESGDMPRLETIGRDVAATMLVDAIEALSVRVAALELVSLKSVSRVEAVAETPVASETDHDATLAVVGK